MTTSETVPGVRERLIARNQARHAETVVERAIANHPSPAAISVAAERMRERRSPIRLAARAPTNHDHQEAITIRLLAVIADGFGRSECWDTAIQGTLRALDWTDEQIASLFERTA